MKRNNERGIALVLALLLTSVMSVLAVSLMFLSQTETYATMNYRMMTQARFAGEAGIQQAGAFLTSTQMPVFDSVANPISAYNLTVSPVTYNGAPVVLSASPAKAANFPLAPVQTAFAAAAAGPLTAGNTEMQYTAYAELMTLQTFEQYGGNQGYAATWKVTGVGSFANSPNSSVEVTSIIELPMVPANAWAAFATNDQCGSLDFRGNIKIDSYDSRVAGNATPAGDGWGGNVGTFGNLHLQGSVDVYGNLSTPRTGVGDCTAGAVTAMSETGHASVLAGEIVPLPGQVQFPAPIIPALDTTLHTITSVAGACTALGQGVVVSGVPPAPPAPGTCYEDAGTGTVTIATPSDGTPVLLPSIALGTGITLALDAGATSSPVYANSITTSGTGKLNIVTGATESIVLGIGGKNADGTDMAAPLDLGSNGWGQNNALDNYNAAAFQIVYAGTGTISMYGNDQAAAVLYAPNAPFVLKGTADWFGSVLSKTVLNEGDASIFFDRRLLAEMFIMGRPMAANFSWQRF